MKGLLGNWKLATVSSSGTVSTAVDLGEEFENLQVDLPAIDSSTISLQVSRDGGATYKTLGISDATAATTGSVITTLVLGGFQFIKIVCGSSQTGGARSIYVRGIPAV